jgi:hypothetical protein
MIIITKLCDTGAHCFLEFLIIIRNLSGVVDGGDGLQMWGVAANVLNKQPRIADKGWSYMLGVGRGANNSSP